MLTLLALALTIEQPATAQNYPARPVKLVVPYPPGGPNDVMARILAQKLTEALAGILSSRTRPVPVARSRRARWPERAADGHTLLVANQDVIVQPIIKSKVPYDPFKSFTPVTLVVTAPEMIVVHPSVPAKAMKELIDLLKANPGKYSYASPGFGTTPHLACEWLFKVEYGVDIIHVPFQGAAPAVQSMLSGQTPIFHNVLPAVAPHVRAGTMRPLAVAAAKRSPFFPDVPTLGGGRHSRTRGWLLAGRTGSGRYAESDGGSAESPGRADSHLPDVKERLQTIGFDPASSTPDAAAAHMRAETDKWSKVVREANIKIGRRQGPRSTFSSPGPAPPG